MADCERCSHGVDGVFGNSNTSFLMCSSSGESPLHSSLSKHCKEAHCHRAYIQKLLAQIQRCQTAWTGTVQRFLRKCTFYSLTPWDRPLFPQIGGHTRLIYLLTITRGTLITVTAAFSNGLWTCCFVNLSTLIGEFLSIVTLCWPYHYMQSFGEHFDERR